MAGHSQEGGAKGHLRAAREILADAPLRAPELVAKALLARARHGLGVGNFFLFDLANRPIATWQDYAPLYPDFSRALKLINWQSGDPAEERDKVATSVRCLDAGIAVAPILLVAGRDTASHPAPGFRTAASADEVAAFLASTDCPDEIFVKPAADFGGHGLLRARRAPGGWEADGTALPDRALAERVLAGSDDWGVMLQPVLRNHAAMEAIGGRFGLNTVRMVVALTVDGPLVVCAAMKLLAREGLADNFHDGTAGNLLAGIDVATGRLTPAFGRDVGRHYLFRRFDRHPATGATLGGFELPRWRDAVALGEAVAAAFPGSPLLGLDLAITEEGPVLLEKNLHWNTSIPQLACGEGIRALFRRLLPRLRVADEVRAQAAVLTSGLGRRLPSPRG